MDGVATELSTERRAYRSGSDANAETRVWDLISERSAGNVVPNVLCWEMKCTGWYVYHGLEAVLVLDGTGPEVVATVIDAAERIKAGMASFMMSNARSSAGRWSGSPEVCKLIT